MPLYTYQCPVCDTITDEYRTVENRNDAPDCECGPMRLKIVPTQVAPVMGGGDFQGYMCPVTDKWITSRKERREIMKRHDLIETGDRGSYRGKMASGFKPGEDRGE